MACTYTFSPGSWIQALYETYCCLEMMLMCMHGLLAFLTNCMHFQHIMAHCRTATHTNEELLSVKLAERFMYQHVGHNKAAFPCAADNCLLCWAAYNQAKQ